MTNPTPGIAALVATIKGLVEDYAGEEHHDIEGYREIVGTLRQAAEALTRLELERQDALDAAAEANKHAIFSDEQANNLALAAGKAEATISRLIAVAGEAIGTHPDMRSEGCVDALVIGYNFALKCAEEARAEAGRLEGELSHVARSLAWQQDERLKAEAALAALRGEAS